MSSELSVVSATRAWLETLVIEYNFCPFARRVVESGRIQFFVANGKDIESVLFDLSSVCSTLDGDDAIETALLILPRGFELFDVYLDLVEAAQSLTDMSGYLGVYQLASFHPDYCFEGTEHDDAANYTNRSPYPMLHVLREESVELAVSQHPNPEAIPAENIARAREIGVNHLHTILRRCMAVAEAEAKSS